MSFYSRIRCGNCRGIYDLHAREMRPYNPSKCPFCNMEMPDDQWAELVRCFRAVREWNVNSRISATNDGTPLFSAEIRRHFVPREKVVYDETEVE